MRSTARLVALLGVLVFSSIPANAEVQYTFDFAPTGPWPLRVAITFRASDYIPPNAYCLGGGVDWRFDPPTSFPGFLNTCFVTDSGSWHLDFLNYSGLSEFVLATIEPVPNAPGTYTLHSRVTAPAGSADGYVTVRVESDAGPASCGDQRDSIIQQYVDRSVVYATRPFRPGCADFTNVTNGVVSRYFTFSELRSPTTDWAIIRNQLLTNLDTLRANYGLPLIINTTANPNRGYRTPQDEYDVDGGSEESYVRGGYHQLGLAADIQAGSDPIWNAIKQQAGKLQACVEPQWRSGYGYIHVDWRPSDQCADDWKSWKRP